MKIKEVFRMGFIVGPVSRARAGPDSLVILDGTIVAAAPGFGLVRQPREPRRGFPRIPASEQAESALQKWFRPAG